MLGAVAIAVFLTWESRAAQPMIPLGLFRRASFSAAVAAGFLTGAAIYAAAFLTSQFFQLAAATRRWQPGCGSCPGPRRRCWSPRSRARSRTG